ncbi:hypothetical protein Tco_0237551 [Tanacetum coccineum]
MAAYEVPPSPDYIPGPEVPPSPDYITWPRGTTITKSTDALAQHCMLSYLTTTDHHDNFPSLIQRKIPKEGGNPADYPISTPGIEPSHIIPPREEVERLLALTTPPPSPLTPLSSPLPHIPSPTPNSPTHIEIPESCLPLRKRVRFASPTPSREVGRVQQQDPSIDCTDHRRGGQSDGVLDLLPVVERRLPTCMANYGGCLKMTVSTKSRVNLLIGIACSSYSGMITELQSPDNKRQSNRHNGRLQSSMDPQKVLSTAACTGEAVAVPEIWYAVSMLCKPVKYYGIQSSILVKGSFVLFSYPV